MNREEYLEKAVEKFRPLFKKNNYDIPSVKVSCGVTSNPFKVLGVCYPSESTFDGTRHIFISPAHKGAEESLGTLSHELLHSCLPSDVKHGAEFKKGMKLIGLEGKAKATTPSVELLALIITFVEELGDYPNPPLLLVPKKKKDRANSKKSFKLFCPLKRDGSKNCLLTEKTTGGDYMITASKKNLKLGFPLCPGCSKEMEMEDEDFELYKLSLEE